MIQGLQIFLLVIFYSNFWNHLSYKEKSFKESISKKQYLRGSVFCLLNMRLDLNYVVCILLFAGLKYKSVVGNTQPTVVTLDEVFL